MEKLSHEDFVKKAAVSLNPVEVTNGLAREGKIVIRGKNADEALRAVGLK